MNIDCRVRYPFNKGDAVLLKGLIENTPPRTSAFLSDFLSLVTEKPYLTFNALEYKLLTDINREEEMTFKQHDTLSDILTRMRSLLK